MTVSELQTADRKLQIAKRPNRTEGLSASDGLEVRIQPFDAYARDAWRELESRLGEVPLTVSSAWTDAWLSHYGDLVRHRVLIAEAGERVVGMALISQGIGVCAGPVPLRTRHMGTAGEPDGESVCVEYNSLLAEPEWKSPFAQAVAEWLCNERCDNIRLDGLDEDTWHDFAPHLPNATVTRRPSRYFNFAAARHAGKSVIDLLGSSTRSNIRRLLKKYGDLETEWAETPAHAREIFGELVQLHQARWQSIDCPGAYASIRFLAFQSGLIARLVPEKRVVLFRVRQQGCTVGCLMLLVDRGRLLDYQSGFAAFTEKPSPGIVTHYLCQTEALTRGYAAYDFLVGDKRHKENLSTDSVDLIWARVPRPTWRCGVIKIAKALRRRRAADVNRPAAIETEDKPCSP